MIGSKRNKRLYENLIKKSIPQIIDLYVEPFGGEFGLYYMIDKPKISIYNDINYKTYEKVYNRFKSDNTIKFFNTDYKDIIEAFDSKNTFFYLDPPYFELYKYEYNFTNEQHIELYNTLKNIKGRFLLSYNNKEFITNLYKNYKIDKYTGNNIHHNPEITIKNY